MLSCTLDSFGGENVSQLVQQFPILIKNSRAESTALEDQRILMQKLVEKKKADENQSEYLQQVLEATKDMLPDDIFPSGQGTADELLIYCSLIQRIISQIDACQSSLGQARYSRIQNGIFRLHSDEVVQSELTHGPRVAQFLKGRFSNLCKQ
jgi:hypothetical protein